MACLLREVARVVVRRGFVFEGNYLLLEVKSLQITGYRVLELPQKGKMPHPRPDNLGI